MRSFVEVTTEDVRQYPLVMQSPKNMTLTLGDLHGHSMKLVYLLIRLGIMNISEKAYQDLWRIYETPCAELTMNDLGQFETILKHADIEQPGLLILIGDELADRGHNDFFTLLILARLHEEKVCYRIMMSNHGAIALTCLELNFVKLFVSIDQQMSLLNLFDLIQRLPELQEKISSWIDGAYIEHLAVLGYSITPQGFFIYSHAPIDMATLGGLSLFFEVPDSALRGIERIIHDIDAINMKATEWIKNKEFYSKMLHPSYQVPYSEQRFNKQQTHPFYDLLWNRYPVRPVHAFSKLIYVVHGHVGEGIDYGPCYINTDSHWCKSPTDEVGECRLCCVPTTKKDMTHRFYQEASASTNMNRVSPDNVSVDLEEEQAIKRPRP